MTVNYCSRCGSSVMENDRFCRSCGQPLSQTAQAQQSQAQQTQAQQVPRKLQRQSKKPGVNLLLLFGLVVGGVLIFTAVWLLLPDTAVAPSRLESNPASQDTSGLPYPEVPRIDPEEAKAQFDAGTAVFVDTRDLNEYEAAHIPGAIHMTLDEIEARHMELTVSPEIITYCT